MKKLAFGELELAILKIVREKKKVTVREVYETLKTKSYTTIMTVMSRLANKKELKREKLNREYIYSLADTTKTSSKNLLHRIQQKIFNGSPSAMISYLLSQDEKISKEELKKIEDLLKKKKEHG